MSSGRLLGICGSLRAGSYNRKLMLEAARLYDPEEFVVGNLRLPLYDGDLEDAEGIPPEVQALADQIAQADAVVIAGPEYNKALSGVLKNALDWVSRAEGNPWKDKPVAIMSAAGGRAGGERTQFSLRLALVPFQPLILQGPEVLVGNTNAQFDDEGRLINEINLKALEGLMTRLKAEATRA
ncbi:NAD(P)H-dependent oxidoreductase [Roseibacterium beibuensis]|uniref:NAD(P)H-dependent FMN reductase n=1 Tax=[Roseibacterium] beibuensis TaxID=1193142 RepID=A0ABP9LFL3_9RHOB|nr:NAD(P)H-dependent oxidoreductase [Roseibacterium beibuensis]MCS6623301.1 NAD(P)H-dependent oxidoreductase [Roseibacterium beibuensis]